MTLDGLVAGDRVRLHDGSLWELAFAFWSYGAAGARNPKDAGDLPSAWWCREIVEDFGGGELRIDGRSIGVDDGVSEIIKRQPPPLSADTGSDVDPLLSRAHRPGTLL